MLKKAVHFLHLGLLLWIGSLSLTGCKTQENAVKSTQPQNEVLEKSLLWRIDNSGLPGPSYLFGTIHIMSKDKYFFTGAMDSAFHATEILALEIDLEEAMDFGSQFALLQQALMKNDTTLRDLLTANEYEIVEKHFTEIGIPIFLLERLKPMFLTVFSSSDLFGGSFDMGNIKSYELELMEMANDSGKDIVGLETIDYQMSIFDSIPYSYQAQMLVSSILESEEENNTFETLIQYYIMQDLPMLDSLINQDGSIDKYRDILVDNRNKNWIPVMEELMKERSVFFAIGAGHLVGNLGVIRLLKESGYEVKAIFSE